MKFIKTILFLLPLMAFQNCSNSTINKNTTESFNLKNITLDEETVPVIILGGGIGGLTSAIYLGLAGYKPLIIEGELPGGLITRSTSVHNWPGEIEISGIKLTEKMKNQAINAGAIILEESVYEVDFSTWPYLIKTNDLKDKNKKHEYKALSCIIATGTNPNLLNVPGEKEYFGNGVSTCAVCDGNLYKNKTVAVVGSGDSAITDAAYLSKIATKVYILIRGDKLKGNYTRKENVLSRSNVEVLYNTEIAEIIGSKDQISSIKIKNNKTNLQNNIQLNGLFLAIGAKPNTSIFKDQISLDENGYIKLIKYQETSQTGVFAVGDIANPLYKQATLAQGNGGVAATQTIDFLENIGYKTETINNNEATNNKTTKNKPIEAVKEKIETIIHINNAKELDDIIKNSKDLILIDFFSETCPPCRRMSPIFQSLSEEFYKKIKFIKVDIRKNSELSYKYKIQSIPTFIFINKEQIIEKIVGFQSYDELKNKILNLK